MPFSENYVMFHKVFDKKYMVHTLAVFSLSGNLVQDRKQCKRSNTWTVKKGPGVKLPCLVPACNISSVRVLGSSLHLNAMKLVWWAQECIRSYSLRKSLLGANSNLQSNSYLGQNVTCKLVIYCCSSYLFKVASMLFRESWCIYNYDICYQ